MDNGSSSTGKKVAIGIGIVVVVAIVAIVVLVFLKPGASNNENTNVNVTNGNTAASVNNNQNASNTVTTPGTSTSTSTYNTETPDANTNTNAENVVSGDLTESSTSTAANDNAQLQQDIEYYKRLAQNIHRDENGNYRPVATDERTDLDKAMLEANSTEFVNTLFFEKDKWRRTQVMNKLVDIDYVRENNPTSLNYDWKTGWEYSLVRDDNLQYTAVTFLEVESAYAGGGSCLFDISYIRTHHGDDGGPTQQMAETDVYRVSLSDSGKIRDIKYVATRQPQG